MTKVDIHKRYVVHQKNTAHLVKACAKSATYGHIPAENLGKLYYSDVESGLEIICDGRTLKSKLLKVMYL